MAELKSKVVEISGGVGKVSSTALDKSAGRELIINAPKKVTVINKPRRLSGRSMTSAHRFKGGLSWDKHKKMRKETKKHH